MKKDNFRGKTGTGRNIDEVLKMKYYDFGLEIIIGVLLMMV